MCAIRSRAILRAQSMPSPQYATGDVFRRTRDETGMKSSILRRNHFETSAFWPARDEIYRRNLVEISKEMQDRAKAGLKLAAGSPAIHSLTCWRTPGGR